MRLYFLARLPDPADAEDYVQRAFEKVLRARARDPLALLRVTARGLLVDAYKARPRDESWEQLIGPEGDRFDHFPQFQTYTYEDSTFAADLDRAVRVLDQSPRDAFILGELRGVPSREAGPLLGVSHTTAAARRDAATAQVREEIKYVRKHAA